MKKWPTAPPLVPILFQASVLIFSLNSFGADPENCTALLTGGSFSAQSGFSNETQFSFNPVAYVKAHARPLNFVQLVEVSTPVIFIGESHDQDMPKQLIAENMKSLKDAGVTHIGLEMFNSNRQSVLDGYLAGKVPYERVLKVLKGEWSWYPEEYMNILNAARTHGVRVIALDGRHRLKKSQRHFSDSSTTKFRDQHMANILATTFQEDQVGKILVLVGANHARCGEEDCHVEARFLPNILLGRAEIKSVSYRVQFIDDVRSQDPVRKAVKKSKKRYKRGLFLPVPREEVHYDGYIFF